MCDVEGNLLELFWILKHICGKYHNDVEGNLLELFWILKHICGKYHNYV